MLKVCPELCVGGAQHPAVTLPGIVRFSIPGTISNDEMCQHVGA